MRCSTQVREMLRKPILRGVRYLHVIVEKDRATRGGSLVDSKDIRHFKSLSRVTFMEAKLVAVWLAVHFSSALVCASLDLRPSFLRRQRTSSALAAYSFGMA